MKILWDFSLSEGPKRLYAVSESAFSEYYRADFWVPSQGTELLPLTEGLGMQCDGKKKGCGGFSVRLVGNNHIKELFL